jgi:gliding motility-associated-like protein
MKFIKLFFLLAGILLLSSEKLSAGHIIGGEVTYECLGNGSYRIKMLIYIDCFCTNCAQFDDVASFGLYSCGNNIPCSSLGQFNALAAFNIPLGPVRQVPAPDYPCIETPPNLCVREGTYEFTINNLPVIDESYFIMYQRCCRNVTINNIIDPGKSGATFFTEITPEAQRACNNSPVFNDFPPTVICARIPFEFDHSASDMDGDSLAYRFCAPKLGGGVDGGPDAPMLSPITCTGIVPRPGCPPPYQDVIYRPPYSAGIPMGGDPIITIDPVTGIISGTPEVIGQFVVGVCVDEFRDGEFLGTLRRDFQFNTAGCDVQVFAGIAADQVVDDREYLLTSCGENTITFDNTSGQERFIRQYSWEFEDGQPQTSSARNATITFPDTGEYRGLLVINPGLPCSDSADIFVNIYPAITADFTFEYDTCLAEGVQFMDLSFTEADFLTDWNWEFADGNMSNSQNPLHLYNIPGVFPVSLTVRDNNNCEDEIIIPVSYFPVPEEIIAGPEEAEACQPAPISFFNLSTPIDSTYSVFWDFGDGNTGEGLTPIHIYEDPGTYTVYVRITSPIGCTTDTIFPSVVNILPSPVADFIFSPQQLSNFNRTVTFTDLSIDAIQWDWAFDSLSNSFLQSPVFTFPDTGMYEVQLIVTHPSGCKDTIVQIIDVIPEVRYFLPNAFTPNEDGFNDEFRGNGSFQFMSDFTMTIWNRWGELLFETKNPEAGWNGRKFNQGQMSPPGVYVCVVQYTTPRGERIELKGFATLVQ